MASKGLVAHTMNHRTAALSAVGAFGLILVAACSDSTSGGSSGAGDAGAATATLRTRIIVPPTKAARQDGYGTSSSALSGQNAAAGLEELSYAIRSIAICKNMTTVGTGFSNPQDCLTVYDAAPVPELEYDPSGDLLPLASAARGLDAPFVDLMTAAGRARLATTRALSAADVREYQYGYITWYPPIKVKASVAITGASAMYTRDGATSVVVMPDGYRHYVTTASAPFSSAASAERAVVISPNGGNWFKFQRPLVILASDVTAAPEADASAEAGAGGAGIDLDLVFDPEAMITAFTERASESNAPLVDSTGAGFHVPMLDLAPIVRTAGKTTVREDWVADLGGGFGYRLSLYGLEPDPNRTIYGVLSRMFTTNNTVAASDWFAGQKIAGVSVAADGTRTFVDPSGEPIVRGFTRTAVAADAGATTNGEIRCTGNDERPMPHGFFLPGCATGTWRAVTFTAR